MSRATSSSGTCSSCGARIVWAATPSGKSIPLDADPQQRFVLEGGVVRYVPTFITHFASCPNATQHRKPRSAAEGAKT